MTSVTRSEFYQAMGMVWLYITILFGNALRGETRRWPDVVLWALALLCSFYYIAKGIRSREKPVSA